MIIIKNQYTLSLIFEFHDQVRKTKRYITFDLRETYNLVRIKEEEK